MNGSFGETSVRAVSADQARVSAYAALRLDGRLTIVLINKTSGVLTSNLTISQFAPGASARVYGYSAADLAHIVRQPDLPLSGAAVAVQMPASSITLVVVPPAPAPADFDDDGDVDGQDFEHFQECATGPAGGPPSLECDDADLDRDLDVDQADYGAFQRCLSGTGITADPACAE
jgi:hypothetical protein